MIVLGLSVLYIATKPLSLAGAVQVYHREPVPDNLLHHQRPPLRYESDVDPAN